MLSNTNPSINNPQVVVTQPNSQVSAPVSTAQAVRKVPNSIIWLLVLLSLQLCLGIAILVLKVVLGYRGFDGVYPMQIDPLQCSDIDIWYKYYGSQTKILSITLVMISVCVLLTIILLIIAILAAVRSKRLPFSAHPSSPAE